MSPQKNTSLKVRIVIPVFNVEKTIATVLEKLVRGIQGDISEILIIDNHSSDSTVSIIHDFLRENHPATARVTLLIHAENYGYGSSVKAGFEYFSTRDVSHIMVIHGDHQVDPAWLMGRLLEPMKVKPDINIVLASRFKSESNTDGYSPLRKLGNYFFNVTTHLCTGHRMSDSGTAMIIVQKDTLGKVPFINLSNSWQFHPQLNILLYSLPNVKIEEIPMDWADSDAASAVPLFRYGLILLKMLLLYWTKKHLLMKNSQHIFSIEPISPNRQFTVAIQIPGDDSRTTELGKSPIPTK
jgi:glycosyltransferase involved in cell wall biosynthesis